MSWGKLVVPVVIFLGVSGVIVQSQDVNDQYIVGEISDNSYVGHGHITDISDLSCYDSEIQSSTESYHVSDGKLYDYEYRDLPEEITIIATHSVNVEDPSQLVTTIQSYEKTQSEIKEMGIKVPIILACKPLEKVVYNIKKLDSVALTPITNVCPNGKIILPTEQRKQLSEIDVMAYNITESDDGKFWVINSRHTYQYIPHFDYNEAVVKGFDENNIDTPVSVRCEIEPSKI